MSLLGPIFNEVNNLSKALQEMKDDVQEKLAEKGSPIPSTNKNTPMKTFEIRGQMSCYTTGGFLRTQLSDADPSKGSTIPSSSVNYPPEMVQLSSDPAITGSTLKMQFRIRTSIMALWINWGRTTVVDVPAVGETLLATLYMTIGGIERLILVAPLATDNTLGFPRSLFVQEGISGINSIKLLTAPETFGASNGGVYQFRMVLRRVA